MLVELDMAGPDPRRVTLRALTGADEAALAGVPAGQAGVALLRRLVVAEDGAAVEVGALGVADADRLLAALYTALYGDDAECQARCRGCGADYEFRLQLSQLIAAQDRERPGPPADDGSWALPDGRRVRAPRLDDIAAAGDANALVARLVVAGDATADTAAVTDFLERAAPLLSLDLDATCPHCARGETIRFDIAQYLGARLAGERPFLLREVHLLASRYGWGLAEILSLGRADRRAFAALIEAERAAALRPLRRAG